MHLVDRTPLVPPERLVQELVPPPRFAAVRFDTYRPDPAQPTQADALETLTRFAHRTNAVRAGARRADGAGRWFGFGGSRSRRDADGDRPGVYLDGGFGVGKTHLLASLWHACEGPAAFGTFVEYTNLVGAIGFGRAVEALSTFSLVCIDEFELDDPGDTVLMSRLLRELVDAGVRLAATSNTLPGALGEGRFAAEDFTREIQGLAARFTAVRIDGEDYRHRGSPEAPEPLSEEGVHAVARLHDGVSVDDFAHLLDHLAGLHPSRYGALLDGVRTVCWTGVRPVPDQSVALRLVVLADRMYDRDLPLVTSGGRLEQVFGAEMLAGGYRKKYRRALSRLTALAREGRSLVAPGAG